MDEEVFDDHPYLKTVRNLVRDALRAGSPTLGSCPDLKMRWGVPKEDVVEQAGRFLGAQQVMGREDGRRFVKLRG